MAWQSKVPAWVISLVSNYVIPEDAEVITGIEFGKLEDNIGEQEITSSKLTATYPGLIPNYSLDPEIQPQTNGTQYNLKCKKAVGFYGVKTEVSAFDEKRINKWTFPLVRRKFGFLTISRDEAVAHQEAIDYEEQFHFSNAVLSLVLNYDDDFSIRNIFNDADKFSLNRVDFFLYPTVKLFVSFLPIWEVWAIRFLSSNSA